tara:strand:+ start:6018 stop:6494 length:477 start_codon:yes stop_codon:yes gene_type:complete
MGRFEKIKKVTLTKPYFFYFLISAGLFIVLNIYINKLNVTGPMFLFSNPKLGLPILFFIILIAGLIALNINLIIFKFKEIKSLNKKGSGLTFFGVFGGFLGGACPSCFVGLFPAVLGLFGISVSLSILPFYGLEIQAVSAVLLIISVSYLTKETVCKI